MWYFVDGVLILKDSVWPTFTLIDVANPWMVESPAPLICQSEGASPGSWFSHTIGFDVQAARADCARSAPKARVANVSPIARVSSRSLGEAKLGVDENRISGIDPLTPLPC